MGLPPWAAGHGGVGRPACSGVPRPSATGAGLSGRTGPARLVSVAAGTGRAAVSGPRRDGPTASRPPGPERAACLVVAGRSGPYRHPHMASSRPGVPGSAVRSGAARVSPPRAGRSGRGRTPPPPRAGRRRGRRCTRAPCRCAPASAAGDLDPFRRAAPPRLAEQLPGLVTVTGQPEVGPAQQSRLPAGRRGRPVEQVHREVRRRPFRQGAAEAAAADQAPGGQAQHPGSVFVPGLSHGTMMPATPCPAYETPISSSDTAAYRGSPRLSSVPPMEKGYRHAEGDRRLHPRPP